MQTGCFKTSWNVPGAIRISRGPYRQKGKRGQLTYRPLWPQKWLLDGYLAGTVSEAEYTSVYNRHLAELPGGARRSMTILRFWVAAKLFSSVIATLMAFVTGDWLQSGWSGSWG